MSASDTETEIEAERESGADAAAEPEGSYDVVIVGGGVAGLSAGIFTARAGLETLVVDDPERRSILRRNAHLENVPGFPAGVNSRLFLDMTREQAERAGCAFREGVVTATDEGKGGFRLTLEAGEGDETLDAEYVIAASWADSSYLEGLEVDLDQRGSKQFVLGRDNDGPAAGRTGVEGLYAAGRIADGYHQTVISAGNGAQVALTLIHDADIPFYHDWVAPEGYFTDRDREIPPGIEEIDEEERRRRERESIAVMREHFAEPHPDEPTLHPSLTDDE